MKKILILKASTLLLISSALGNQNSSKAIIEFSHGGSRLTSSVIHQIEQVYDKLPINFQVEMVTVSNYEQQRDYPTATRLSIRRCKAIYEHLRARGVEARQFKVKQYDRRRFVRTISYDQSQNTDRLLIHQLIVTRQPERPLQFTHSGLNPFGKGGSSYTIDNSEGSTIYSSDGVSIRFPERAFEDQYGFASECDLIDIELYTYLSKAEFLEADITSNAAKKMLESGGMLHVSATCGGQELRLRRGKLIDIFIPSYDVQDDMQVFEGAEEFNLINWNRMSWSDVKVQSEEELLVEVEWREEDDGIIEGIWSEGDGYLLESSKLGWINCDRFYEIDNPTQLFVDLPKSYPQVGVRMIFDTINSILPGYVVDESGLVGFENVPSGERVWLCAYGKSGERYVFAEQQIVLGTQNRISLEPKEIGLAELKSELGKF